jgi:glycosyltransferase involved in cell wall biosynthesis
MAKANKKKVLVLASTFPRWKNDTNPPFVYDLSQGLAKEMDETVLAPHYPGAKDTETMGKLKVHRFHYFFERFEKLAGNGGMLPTLKANKLYYLTVPFFMLAEIIATIKLVREIKPDVIHAHWILPQGLAAYINKLINKTPYVVTSHGGDIFGLQNKFLIKLKKLVLDNAKSITVVSSAIKSEVLKINPILESKIEVVPMGVDTKLFNPNKYDEKLKKKYGITGPFLLFVGRLVEKKGVKYLIGAMPAIIKKFPKTKLLIVGSGPLEAELKNHSEKLNLSKSIVFVGALEHKKLPKYFATADIFISPSITGSDGDREGSPVSIMEGLSSGCKIITTIGDLEIIKPVKQKNVHNISSRVIKDITSNSGNHSTSHKDNFSWSRIFKSYVRIINE